MLLALGFSPGATQAFVIASGFIAAAHRVQSGEHRHG